MQDKKGQTQKLIMARVAEGPEKNQLSANMDLTKPRKNRFYKFRARRAD